MNLPNILTVSRIILIPVFVVTYYLPFEWNHIAAAILFFLAGCTDWLDGYLARKLNQATPFGAFLDPVADKLMVAMSLAMIIESFHSVWVTVPAMIIIGREMVVSALREWMAEQGKRETVAVSFIGKFKTMCQMGSIMLLILGHESDWFFWSGIAMMYFASALTIYSMYQYLIASWVHLFVEE